MKSMTIILSILLFMSCSDSALQHKLETTKKQLADVEAQLASATSDTNTEYPLVHVVYFKVKPDADQAALIEEINKIEAIEVLHELEVGTFKDLGDQRALSDYQIVMSMAFANEEDYKTYQSHELHLNLKKVVGAYLAGPPATYDYTK